MAAPVIVNTTEHLFGGSAPAASYNLTIPATTGGNQLIIVSSTFAGASTGASVSDNLTSASTNNSDTFAKDGGPIEANAGATQVYLALDVWRCSSVTAGSTSVTANYANSSSAGTSLFGAFCVLEVSGLAASPIDGGFQSSVLAATNTLSLTTTGGFGDLALFWWSGNVGTSPGAPWVELATSGDLMFKQSSASNTTYSATVTGSPTDPFVAAMIAYAGTGGPPPMPPLVLGMHWDIQQTPVERHWLTRL